jgi:hypothetical protein
MEEHITLEMMLYGATSFGGSIIYLGNNKDSRSERWKLFSVLITGFLFGVAFTIPVQETIENTFSNIHIGEGSRVGIALIIGMFSSYISTAINKTLYSLTQDPKLLTNGIVEVIKRIFNLKYDTVLKTIR